MVLCMYLTSLVGLVFTLFNQTFDHLMASPSIEFSAAQWKRLCCEAELIRAEIRFFAKTRIFSSLLLVTTPILLSLILRSASTT